MCQTILGFYMARIDLFLHNMKIAIPNEQVSERLYWIFLWERRVYPCHEKAATFSLLRVSFLTKCFPGKTAHPARTINNTFLTHSRMQASGFLHKTQTRSSSFTHTWIITHKLKALRMWVIHRSRLSNAVIFLFTHLYSICSPLQKPQNCCSLGR